MLRQDCDTTYKDWYRCLMSSHLSAANDAMDTRAIISSPAPARLLLEKILRSKIGENTKC
jgi:hypothetical protein